MNPRLPRRKHFGLACRPPAGRAGQVGFTLVELLVVIAIIAILISIGLASFSRIQRSARDSQRQTDLQDIAGALEIYYSDHNEYPADTGALTPNYMKEIPRDPTSNNVYNNANGNYLVGGSDQIYCLIIVDLENDPPSDTECPVDGNDYNYVVSSRD